jgi:hypothetical protein
MAAVSARAAIEAKLVCEVSGEVNLMPAGSDVMQVVARVGIERHYISVVKLPPSGILLNPAA